MSVPVAAPAPPFDPVGLEPVSWPAPAKINLCLRVTGRRADGYHRLQTLFQFLDFGDALRFTPRDDGQIRLLTATGGWPVDDDLAVRAARRLRAAAGRADLGVDIAIDKRVPAGGGLGGGSSDAATALVVLNRLWNTGLDAPALGALGLALGADVPVFVDGRAAWAEGVGEVLTPVAPPEDAVLLLVPPVSVPTAAVFGAGDLPRNETPVAVDDVLAGRVPYTNACVRAARRLFPVVGQALDALDGAALDAGARGPAQLSGTGASTFRRYATPAAARAAAAALGPGLPPDWLCRVARAQNTSALRLAIMAAAPDGP